MTATESLNDTGDPPNPSTPRSFVDTPYIQELYTGRVTTQYQGDRPQKFVTYLPTGDGTGYDYKQRFGVLAQDISVTVNPAGFRINTNGIVGVDTAHVQLVSELVPGVSGQVWFLQMTFTLTAQAAILVNVAYQVTLIRKALQATEAGSPTKLNSQLPEMRDLPDRPTV